MKIGNLTIAGRLFLAPLAGVSIRPFRIMARSFGAAMCYTEMISVEALVREQEKTLKMIDIADDDHPVGVQLFGADPQNFARAVKLVERFNPDVIDVNMGCPVRKVIAKNGGAALLNNLPLAYEIIAAAVENSPVPVTIKIRSGWMKNDEVYLELSRAAERLGVAAITLHPRYKTQSYSEPADWLAIAKLKREVLIPVIGNGDIENGPDAERMLAETGCDAVMLGRAAMKNPFVFRQIKGYLESGLEMPDLSLTRKLALALEHAGRVVDYFGEVHGIKMMRKHLLWYTKGFPEGGPLRKKLMQAASLGDVRRLFDEYINHIGINDGR